MNPVIDDFTRVGALNGSACSGSAHTWWSNGWTTDGDAAAPGWPLQLSLIDGVYESEIEVSCDVVALAMRNWVGIVARYGNGENFYFLKEMSDAGVWEFWKTVDAEPTLIDSGNGGLTSLLLRPLDTGKVQIEIDGGDVQEYDGDPALTIGNVGMKNSGGLNEFDALKKFRAHSPGAPAGICGAGVIGSAVIGSAVIRRP